MKNTIIALVALVLIGGGLYFFTQSATYQKEQMEVDTGAGSDMDTVSDGTMPIESESGIGDGVEALDSVLDETKTVIGKSSEGHDITAYHYGSGEKEILFIGGIHAGYSWNTVLVAYELMDYLDNPESVPDGVKVTVIPTLNPDGQNAVIGTTGQFTAAAVPTDAAETVEGRFNGNDVDLNRNFDCDWQTEGVWQNKKVSGGTAAFSEPESAALRDYVAAHAPTAVIAYYAAAGGVYASSCHNGVAADTTALTNLYADAAGYSAHQEFDFYEVTGDMVNWFAKKGVPAISILLSDHTNTEWAKNVKGIEAVLAHYAQ